MCPLFRGFTVVLVGGLDYRDATTNLLGVWEAEAKNGPTLIHLCLPGFGSSTVAYQQWLLVVVHVVVWCQLLRC